MKCSHLRFVRVVFLILAAIASSPQAIDAQTNSWTSPTSGNWEDMNWSLGTLPGVNQTILFTNAGSKTLAIGPNTVQNYPQTLNIQSLVLSAPENSSNTLLMNYSGPETSLLIGSPENKGILFVESNSAFSMFSAGLTIQNEEAPPFSPFDEPSAYGAFSIGGTLNECANSQVYANFMKLGDISPGIYNLTNSTLTVGFWEIVGGYPATFNQQGGTNVTAALILTNSGEYDLYDGALVLQNNSLSGEYDGQYDLQITLLGGTFKQWGGTVSGSLLFQSGGSYQMSGGIFYMNTMTGNGLSQSGGILFATNASISGMLQTGGTNLVGSIITTGGTELINGYILQGGLLQSGSVYVGTWSNTNSGQYLGYSFSQPGGSHITGSISLSGTVADGGTLAYAQYNFGSGLLNSGSIAANLGCFRQSGGTNQTGSISLDGGGIYSLRSGTLMTQNIQINGPPVTPTVASAFYQSGGTNQVANLALSPGPVGQPVQTPAPSYLLSSGQLNVQNISLGTACTFNHSGGTLNLSGVLTLNGGIWNEQTNGAFLGQLQLGPSNATIQLPTNSCVLQFANSSSLPWANNNALLTITNWNGSLAGGGQHQILFGNNATALTQQQLMLIQFANPAGLSSGIYPAKILPNGEIVPSLQPRLLLSSVANSVQLALHGQSGHTYQIQVSTNLVSWTVWTNQSTSNGIVSITDANASNDPARFYRAVLVQ